MRRNLRSAREAYLLKVYKPSNNVLLNANAKIFISELAKKGGNSSAITPNKVNSSQNIESIPILEKLRISNINKIIIGHLNVNSLRNKFEDLTYLILNLY